MHRTVPRFCSLLLLGALLFAARDARAQGILISPQPGQPFRQVRLSVNATISDGVAQTTVEQVYENPTAIQQEAVWLYPVPDGSVVTAMSLTADDSTVEARLLDSNDARAIYENIVRARRDPALLEYVNRRTIRVRLFPIPAHGTRTIRFTYSEVLARHGGVWHYASPLSTSRFTCEPTRSVSVAVRVHTADPITTVYSPSHPVSVRRTGAHSADVNWNGTGTVSDSDFDLYFGAATARVGMSMLTWRAPGDQDGYFLLLASPGDIEDRAPVAPRDIVFVLDRTGSMAGPKIDQARRSVHYFLDSLHGGDRFDVITFNETPDNLAPALMPANADNLQRGADFVDAVQASGGTNIDAALAAALAVLRLDRNPNKMVVFVTDGLPTVGETDIDTILQHVRMENGLVRDPRLPYHTMRLPGEPPRPVDPVAVPPARIYCFGLGYDVNVPFLDRLADQERGTSAYVRPDENLEAPMSAFFAHVAVPVLTNPRLDFHGAAVTDVFPTTLPDLFQGGSAVVAGRFRGEPPADVTLTGFQHGGTASYRVASSYAGPELAPIARIWAARKIGWLANQLRYGGHGPGDKELIDEIISLSREFGIVTEYTSFLVDTDPSSPQPWHIEQDRAAVLQGVQQPGISGAGAIAQSRRATDLAAGAAAPSRYQSGNGGVVGGFGGGGGRAKAVGGARGYFGGAQAQARPDEVRVQSVAGRTFFRQADGTWVDASWHGAQTAVIEIRAYSDAQFAAIRAVPQLGPWLAVGDRVLVRVGTLAVRVGLGGLTSLDGRTTARLAAAAHGG